MSKGRRADGGIVSLHAAYSVVLGRLRFRIAVGAKSKVDL